MQLSGNVTQWPFRRSQWPVTMAAGENRIHGWPAMPVMALVAAGGFCRHWPV